MRKAQKEEGSAVDSSPAAAGWLTDQRTQMMRLHLLCDDLRKVRGVQQIKLVTTTALLPPLHSHGAEESASPAARSLRGAR